MKTNLDAQHITNAGRSLITWLTVVQVVSVISALAYLVLALTYREGASSPVAVPGEPRGVVIAISAVQALMAALYVLVLHFAKGWLIQVRYWATGEATPDTAAVAARQRTLRRWITFFQWLPVVLLLVLTPLAWYGLGQADLGALMPPDLPDVALTPEQFRAAMQLSVIMTVVAFGLPAVIINYVVLGWVRRWMTGVGDTLLNRERRETRLPELALSLGRWFTFFQALLVLFILIILVQPLITPAGMETLADRLSLLVGFLNLALWVALLQWSKVFMFGVTTRAVRRD